MPWLFDDRPDTPAYVQRSVLDRKEDLLIVIRDDDGDWQFLGASDAEPEEIVLICLEDAVLEFPHVVALSSRLAVGWAAEWHEKQNEWVIGPLVEPEV